MTSQGVTIWKSKHKIENSNNRRNAILHQFQALPNNLMKNVVLHTL